MGSKTSTSLPFQGMRSSLFTENTLQGYPRRALFDPSLRGRKPKMNKNMSFLHLGLLVWNLLDERMNSFKHWKE